MSTTAKLHFLPWVRAGAARVISGDDPLDGPLPANATLAPWIRIEGHDAIPQSMSMRGPGHVVSLGAQAFVKVEPSNGTPDFEPNYFPFVEMRPVDLPWRFTPAAPGEDNQLRPWLVLVVVRQQDGVAIVNEPGVPLPVLRIEAPAKAWRELPDLRDAAAWAHVQAAVAPADLEDALAADPATSAAVARLVCPRRLDARQSWVACLVPAFDVGVRAGLGEDGAAVAEMSPAWDVTKRAIDRSVVRLPVYYSWTFSTAAAGDFKSLALRLEADRGETVLGRVDLNVSQPGPPLSSPPRDARKTADFVGALRTSGVIRRDVPRRGPEWLDTELERIVETGAGRRLVDPTVPPQYNPERDDPVVTPPLYGSFQTNRYDVPDADDPTRAWMHTLNRSPELRAIAGLGASVARAGQETFMAAAWNHAGELRNSQRLLDGGKMAAEIGRSIGRRMLTWHAGALVQATERMHPWMTAPATSRTLAAELQSSSMPCGLVSAPFARATRPRTATARLWSSRIAIGDPNAPLKTATATFLAATSPSADANTRRALAFATTTLPVGAWTRDAALEAVPTGLEEMPATARIATAPSDLTRPTRGPEARVPIVGPVSQRHFPATLEGAAALARELPVALRRRRSARQAAPQIVDLSAAASAVSTQIDPMPRIHSSLVGRIPALASLVTAGGALPGRITLGPVFTDPLSLDLVHLDARYLLPGADALPMNRVTLLEADDTFVAAFLVGANHQMSGEMLWREFPVSARHTFFRRFWNTGESGPDDIKPISQWTRTPLGANVTGVTADATTVVLISGDVVRRYPDAHFYLTRGVWDGDLVRPDSTEVNEPLLQGMLNRSTRFYGFNVSTTEMRGHRAGHQRTLATAGWFVTIEEPAHGPRLGLDPPADDGSDLSNGASSWRQLSWGHLVPTDGSVSDVAFAVARDPLPSRNSQGRGRVSWGHNSAHMAAITWRVPFRLFIHADRLTV